MSHKQYTDEFKSEAIKQVTERGHWAHEVGKDTSRRTALLCATCRSPA